MADKVETFEEYMEQNPRRGIPNDFMDKFVEFARKEYKNYGVVNWTHYEDDYEECMEEVNSYIGESMEALLLFQKFLNSEVSE